MSPRPFVASLGRDERPVLEELRVLGRERFAQRLRAGDPTLWTQDAVTRKRIEGRLGWLTSVDAMAGRVEEITTFARSIKAAGVRDVVLLGMGGSSLCPEVCRRIFGVATGYPDLHVLDSTDPAAIRRVERRVTLKRTLFIVASKSGTTIEVDRLSRYFFEKLKAAVGERAGAQMVAITDPGTPLEQQARAESFRHIFLNPADIGGRYSALSCFGLVPAALIGVNLRAFLTRAKQMARRCASSRMTDNPGIALGVILGVLGKSGRDKVTLVSSSRLRSIGGWIEQLVAESTGKDGKGLIPVDGEPLGGPTCYGDDRLFIYLKLSSSPDRILQTRLRRLQRAGHPVVRIVLRSPLDLAGEFFRWEVATAVAGSILGVNPFDEPNVAESKDNTGAVLERLRQQGTLPFPPTAVEEGGIRLVATPGTRSGGSLREALRGFFAQIREHDYVALLAFLERSAVHEQPLQQIRRLIHTRYRAATTVGFGPRYLHSTGQLHKGGAGNGLFILITADDRDDLPIPGERLTFGMLKTAQALGDAQALTRRGCRTLHLHLGRDVQQGLKRLVRVIAALAD